MIAQHLVVQGVRACQVAGVDRGIRRRQLLLGGRRRRGRRFGRVGGLGAHRTGQVPAGPGRRAGRARPERLRHGATPIVGGFAQAPQKQRVQVCVAQHTPDGSVPSYSKLRRWHR
jgi:hypothetical protein